MAAINWMPRDWNGASTASAKVYRPMRRSGSAMTNSATTHPARNPMEYRKPSYPVVAIMPQMPRNEAAER